MENSKSAERWALVTAMPSLPCDLDLKVEGGIGGKTVSQERRTLGLGTSSTCPHPRLPPLPPGPVDSHCWARRPGSLLWDPDPLRNTRGSSGPGWEAFLVVWRPLVTQVRPILAPRPSPGHR